MGFVCFIHPRKEKRKKRTEYESSEKNRNFIDFRRDGKISKIYWENNVADKILLFVLLNSQTMPLGLTNEPNIIAKPAPPKERKKHDRFNGMSEEEVSKRTLPDHLANNLDIIIVSVIFPFN